MATDPNVLLDEAKCLGCASNASIAEMLKLALLLRIAGASSFDPALCAVDDLTGGGGDTFDCYEEGDYSTGGLPAGAGTGLEGLWMLSDGYNDNFGDLFETYPVGATGTMNDGTGFSGAWSTG